MPWVCTAINFPDLGRFEDCETEEDANAWIEMMRECANSVSRHLNNDMRKFVREGASMLFLNVKEEDHIEKIFDDYRIEAEVKKLFDDDKDLERIFVDPDGFSDNYHARLNFSFRHYTCRFTVYVRNHKGPYYLTVGGDNICDKFKHCGRPESNLYVTLSDDTWHSVDRSKWTDIIGNTVEHNMQHIFKIPERYGYTYVAV